MQQAIRAARVSEAAWPELQYLWELHPTVTWARDRMRVLFGRHEAWVQDTLATEPQPFLQVIAALRGGA